VEEKKLDMGKSQNLGEGILQEENKKNVWGGTESILNYKTGEGWKSKERKKMESGGVSEQEEILTK